MEHETFYDRILADKSVFDRVIYDLELMSQSAANARTRSHAEVAKNYLTEIQLICEALKQQNG